MSLVPPALFAVMTRTGLDGKVCASAAGMAANAVSSIATSTIGDLMVPLAAGSIARYRRRYSADLLPRLCLVRPYDAGADFGSQSRGFGTAHHGRPFVLRRLDRGEP